MKYLYIIFVLLFLLTGCQTGPKRIIISLNGEWKIEEGSMDAVPVSFGHTVMVPGLVSLAQPEFVNAGPKVKDRRSIIQRDTLREAFWYRRTFEIRKVPGSARLKVSKAMFGTRVFLNGKDLGEHLPCFTPGWFDVRDALRTGENELVIRVGSARNSVPFSIPDGFDFEKDRYIPGIFDDVELHLSGTPLIVSAQVAPEIKNSRVHVRVKLAGFSDAESSVVKFTVAEAKTGAESGSGSAKISFGPDPASKNYLDVFIPLKDCHLWSPDDPFLYKLTIETDGDEYSTRFGMREFTYDTIKGVPMLNGKPYFLRGSNITLYRFFEDPDCGSLPWDTSWVRKLHRSFEQFHWNSLRYCIGIAPESWYNIADEEGILIQNEFPVWYGGKGWNVWPETLGSDELTKEYTEWVEEQCNHPSIIIWDASNETVSHDGKTEEIARAVKNVRGLDLSNRIWDNSYSDVRPAGDVMELHPYHFQNASFKLRDIVKADTNPGGPNKKGIPSPFMKIVNEYGWLWLNRDGSPTTLTSDLYRNLLGRKSTTEQRRELYARYLAAETEFWRCHRQCAGVLHFTALGYSRSDGQTSDHFTNVAKLEYEQNFMKYMHDAFSPVGLMLDEWGNEIEADSYHFFRINAVNDLEADWKGQVLLEIFDGEKLLSGESQQITIPSYGLRSFRIALKTPELPGKYTVIASLIENKTEKPVRSVREIQFEIRHQKETN
ncbi:MAG: glycosyl hydrolase 2 galactose-binding domain-containing protein [Chloroflexota bacterium]